MGLLKRLRAAWPGALRQQITRTGMFYFGAVMLVAMATFISGNNLLYLILAALFSVLFVSGFVSKLVLAGLEVDMLVPPHVTAQRKIRGTLRIKNLKRWMPSFSIQVTGAADSDFNFALYFPVIPAGAGRSASAIEEPFEIQFKRRGRVQERVFQLTTRFPFGFAERRELITLRQEIIVYPCLDPQPGFEELLASVNGGMQTWQRGQSQDFHGIRPYQARESWRRLDWKATAHTGALQVREYSREEDEGAVIYLDLDAAAEHDAWFESAVNCSAFLVYQLAGMGRRLRFRTADMDVTLPIQGDVYTILRYLALVARRPGTLPGAPDEIEQYQIVFSANPARMAALGWGSARGPGGHLLGPDAFTRQDAVQKNETPAENAAGSRSK